MTELPRPTVVRDDWIEMPDGCRLFARIVLPADAEREPVPALLELLPYRLADGTAVRDATYHPYLAGHGYAAVRVDMRGSGNSDGILLDEYLPQEQGDAVALIAWLAGQPWCTGSVGMFGKSWGGFNALQVAARRPPALKAIISTYSADDRYADDVHYMGGCVLGHEALSWASYMLGINALPPDPRHVGAHWRELWRRRVEETPPFAEAWLAHQRRDDFWRQGSVCEDYGAIECAVYLVGGWADGYTNTVPRALAGLSAAGVPCRGLIGPWSHGWPGVALPGPQIGFLQECLRWWEHWLKPSAGSELESPLLRAWLQEYVEPVAGRVLRPGRWVAEDAWPSPRIARRALFAHVDGALRDEPGARAVLEHRGSERTGSDAGAWCPYGHPSDFPPDQRAEDGLSLSFTSEPLTERVEILGAPEAVLELAADRPLALVAVRLTDVAPDGCSLHVSRGLLNLTHRDGHAAPVALEPGARITVCVALDVAGHAFAPGHRIRLALSPTYWPFAWPSPEPVTLTVALGAISRLELPVRPPQDADNRLPPFAEPEQTPPPNGTASAETSRTVRRDVGAGGSEIVVIGEERTHLADEGTSVGERTERRYGIVEGDPLSASVECSGSHHLERDGWRIEIRTRTHLSATAEDFLLTSEVDAYEEGVRRHAVRRARTIPRDGV